MRCSPADAKEVTRIMTHPSVFDLISDDGCPGPEHLGKYVTSMLHNVGTYALMPCKGMVLLYVPVNYVMYDIHIASIRKEVTLRKLLKNIMDTAYWMADHTAIQKYVITIPVIYPAAASIVRKIGFIKEGCLTKAYLKNKKLCDIEMYGVTKEVLCRQQ